jgi:hypothetical protein
MLLSLTLVSSPSTSRLPTIPTEGRLFLGVEVDWNTYISPRSLMKTLEVSRDVDLSQLFQDEVSKVSMFNPCNGILCFSGYVEE